MPLQLLITGDVDHGEAEPLRGWITQSRRSADVKQFRSLVDALPWLESSTWIPDLVVIVQSWPDEYTRDDVERLGRAAPLARWLVSYGAWCESDGRTRDLWPLAVRVPVCSAAARLDAEWRLLCDQGGPALPMSASREESFAVDHPPLARSVSPGSVAVSSPDPAYRRYLLELLTAAGHRVEPDVAPSVHAAGNKHGNSPCSSTSTPGARNDE